MRAVLIQHITMDNTIWYLSKPLREINCKYTTGRCGCKKHDLHCMTFSTNYNGENDKQCYNLATNIIDDEIEDEEKDKLLKEMSHDDEGEELLQKRFSI